MSVHLDNEVKQQWAALILGMVTVRVLEELWDVFKKEFIFVVSLS